MVTSSPVPTPTTSNCITKVKQPINEKAQKTFFLIKGVFE